MNTINTLFRYLGYATLSIALGWLSFLGQVDFIAQIGGVVLTVMLALLSLYVTLSGQLIAQMIDLHKQKKGFVIDGIVDAMKRNVVIEVILIIASLVLLTIKSFLLSLIPFFNGFISVCVNAVVIFSILYFILVIFDSFTGLFKLLKINGSIE